MKGSGMYFNGATAAGDPTVPNEDWIAATSDLLVLLDGATARTETGCSHGAAWYTRKLGANILAGAASKDQPLDLVLTDAIREVAALHPECDLQHPGTPSAAVAIVRVTDDALRYIVLGDVTVILDTTDGVSTVSDQRVSATAAAERAEADRYAIGTPDKDAALVAMKHGELAARNQEAGYWIAATDPAVVKHAITGEVPVSTVKRLALLSDGAARFVDLFGLRSWSKALDLVAQFGPRYLIERVRAAEHVDQRGVAYRRNKRSDDATIVYADAAASIAKTAPQEEVVRPRAEGESETIQWMNRTWAARAPKLTDEDIERASRPPYAPAR
jgi:hypothetical protein